MNEAWANAPSWEHEFMSLEKNFIWLIFEKNYASDDFLKTSELDTLECLSLIKKRKSFWMLINLKKKCPRARNYMQLYECMIEGLRATWHMMSAIQHFWGAVRHFESAN